jgi:hypothetical protein
MVYGADIVMAPTWGVTSIHITYGAVAAGHSFALTHRYVRVTLAGIVSTNWLLKHPAGTVHLSKEPVPQLECHHFDAFLVRLNLVQHISDI